LSEREAHRFLSNRCTAKVGTALRAFAPTSLRHQITIFRHTKDSRGSEPRLNCVALPLPETDP
jgi:hypothetical protein